MKAVKPIYRLFALTMAMLMFSTSVGFAVDIHYCQGKLKSYSLLGKAKNCHELTQKKAQCPHHQKMAELNEGKSKKMETKGCCSNKTYHIQADQDQQIQTSGFELTKPVSQFIFAFVFIYLTDHLADAASPTFTHYYPPLLLRDFPALFQTFRL